MRNHVTFETAVRLKEAGFPQPKPEEGQFWYNPKTERLCAILFNRANWSFRVSYFGSVSNKGGYFKDNFVFAPTAADILRELKRVVGEHIEVHMEKCENEFVVALFENLTFGDFDTILEKDENPAEAAAQAFLNLKAKP